MASETQKVVLPTEAEEVIKLVTVVSGDGTTVQQPLPSIERIVLPKTETKSGLIRWLWVMGYDVKTIYKYLGIKYQMVRNIVTTEPKRAAREDTPPMVIRLKPETDELQDMLDGVLEADMKQSYKDKQKAAKANRQQEGLED